MKGIDHGLQFSTEPLKYDILETFAFIVAFIAVAVTLFIRFIVGPAVGDYRWRKPLTLGACLLGISFCLYYFHLTKVIDPDINAPVTATLLPYSKDVDMIVRESKRDALKATNLVYYQTPEGVVSFVRGSGYVYPQKAVLYRNKIKSR